METEVRQDLDAQEKYQVSAALLCSKDLSYYLGGSKETQLGEV